MNRPAREVLIRYFKGESAPHEHNLVELYLSMDVDSDYVESCIAEVWDELGSERRLDRTGMNLDGFKDELESRTREVEQLLPIHEAADRRNFVWRSSVWVRAIAAVLFVTGITTLIIYSNRHTDVETLTSAALPDDDVLPGNDRAILTLSDGSTVSLSDTQNGQIALQQGLRIEKTNAGEIVYKEVEDTDIGGKSFNSITTPKGGQYRVTLPDGSKAWLNAASSLTYPVQFSKNERRVKMTGEVYFEIAKAVNGNKQRVPFYVETDKQEIQVLGTHFNVNAYSDEPYTTTTLVEGRVQVTALKDGHFVFLQPGQQARLGVRLAVNTVSSEDILSWKSGEFYFNEEELSSILRKLARWYNVDVKYPPALGKIKLTGVFSRNEPLSTIIGGMEEIHSIKIKYVVKERRIIVEE